MRGRLTCLTRVLRNGFKRFHSKRLGDSSTVASRCFSVMFKDTVSSFRNKLYLFVKINDFSLKYVQYITVRVIKQNLAVRSFRCAIASKGSHLRDLFVACILLIRYSLIGLLQLAITRYKIRHAGGQAHYYSRNGTLKQRDLNQ